MPKQNKKKEKGLDEKIEELSRELEKRNTNGSGSSDSFVRKTLDWFYRWDGFITKENGWLSKPEIHAVAIPFGFMSSSFMLNNGLGIIPFVSFFFMWRHGFKLAQDPSYSGHWNDVIDESAYSAISMSATIMFFVYFTAETIDVSILSHVSITSLLGI